MPERPMDDKELQRIKDETKKLAKIAKKLHQRAMQERIGCVVHWGWMLSARAVRVAKTAEQMVDLPEGFSGEGC